MRMIDTDRLPVKSWKKTAAMFQDDYTAGAGTDWALKVAMAENRMLWEIISAIENAPTITQPNEWVNAEERLPEEGESVLCIVNGKPGKNITLCEAYQLGVWYKEDGWLIDEYPEWRDVEVLWWMPLPDAPEGEE